MASPLPDTQTRAGFTLIELLIVIAIIALLAAMILPALSVAQAKGKQLACLNNLKQLALCAQMYTADNAGKLPQNFPSYPDQFTNTWVRGNMKVPNDSTNQSLIQQGMLFPYGNQVPLYRCPADPSRTGGLPRLRSYSMNSWMGSRYMETAGEQAYRTFVGDSELALAGPARLWMIIDEHELSIDDAWFLVTMNDSQPFANYPATRHARGYPLAFADGHLEAYHLRDPRSALLGTEGAQFSAFNSDWIRLKQATTFP